MSSPVIGGYCGSGPQRCQVPFSPAGSSPSETTRSWTSPSMRDGASWPVKVMVSGKGLVIAAYSATTGFPVTGCG